MHTDIENLGSDNRAAGGIHTGTQYLHPWPLARGGCFKKPETLHSRLMIHYCRLCRPPELPGPHGPQ